MIDDMSLDSDGDLSEFSSSSQATAQEVIYFGDEIFFKADTIGSLKYIHSDGFYPSCLKCIDFTSTPADAVDIQGAIFEIAHPSVFLSSEQAKIKDSSSIFGSSKSITTSLASLATANNFNGQISNDKQYVRAGSGENESNPQRGSHGSSSSPDSSPRSNSLSNHNNSSNNNENAGDYPEDSRTALTFNSSFVLRHKRSQKFLSLVEEDLEHFSLVLGANPSLFKISPCFKSQIVQSKNVCYMQFIYLEGIQSTSANNNNNNNNANNNGANNSLNNSSNTTNSNKSIYLVQDEVKPSDEKVLPVSSSANEQHAAITNSSVSSRFADYSAFFGDFYFSPNQKTRFHIDRYHDMTSHSLLKANLADAAATTASTAASATTGSASEDHSDLVAEELLRFGDVVKLFHIETDAFLQYSDEVVNNLHDLEDQGNNNDKDHSSKASVYFAKPSSDSEFNESFTLWRVINPKNVFDGGCIKWTQQIILKCLNRNQYLRVKEIGSARPTVFLRSSFVGDEGESYFHLCEELEDSTNDIADGNFMRTHHANALNSYVRYSSLFRLVHSRSQMTLSARFQNELSDLNPNAAAAAAAVSSDKSNNNLPAKSAKPQSMTESIVDRSIMPKFQVLQRGFSSAEVDQNEGNINNNNAQQMPLNLHNQVILKQDFCEGDITRFQTVPVDEQIENNYLMSTLDLMAAAIPLILQYIRLSEDASKKAAINATQKLNNNGGSVFQFSNPYFTEFIQLLQSAIEHQIMFLLDIETSTKVKFDDSIFRHHKVNSEKQDRAQKMGVLEFSVNLLKAIWSHSSEERIFEILKATKLAESEESANLRKTKAASLSRRRSSQISSFKSRIDQKDEEIQLYKTFQRISRLIYFLIITLCRSNQFNSQNTFTYFTFFKNHLGYSIGATSSILAILKNNEKLLSILHSKNYTDLTEIKTTISRTLSRFKVSQFNAQRNTGGTSLLGRPGGALKIADIAASAAAPKKPGEKKMTLIHIFFKKYAQMFTQSRTYWTNFVQVMNTMCLCKEKALNINQLVIGNELLTSTHHQHLFITLECTSELIYLTVLSRRYELAEFVRIEQSLRQRDGNGSPPQSTTYQFLLKQLELYANLCLDRNYQNKGLLEKRITASALIKYITSEEITTELRALLLSLLINLHFDSCPRKEIQRPCFTKTIVLPWQQPSNPSQSQPNDSNISLNASLQGGANNLNRPLLTSNNSANLNQRSSAVPISQQPSSANASAATNQSPSTTFRGFLSKDSMQGMQEIKHFVVDYLSRSIFSRPGYMKADMLSYNVVKLARLMITFDCFGSDEPEFTKVVESFLVILQTDTNSAAVTSAFNQNNRKANADQNNEEEVQRDQCQLKILQEVLHSLLYYQQIEVDGNLRLLLDFYAHVLFINVPNENQAHADNNLNNLIRSQLESYLPKIQSLKTKNNDAYGSSHSTNNFSRTVSSRNPSQARPIHVNNNGNSINSMNSLASSSSITSQLNDRRRFSDVTLFKGFDEIIVDNSFFNILLKNFVNVGQSDLQTSHLILKILFSNFSQRQNTIRAIKQLQIISSPTEMSVFSYLKTLNARISFVSEMQELWFTGDSQFSQESAFQEINSLMDQLTLAFFPQSRLIQDSNNPEDSTYFEFPPAVTDINTLITSSSANFVRQQMMKNLNIHTHILSIIKEGNMLIAGLQKKHQKSEQLNDNVSGGELELINNLYRSCYDFLYLFVQSNTTNQKILAQQLDALLQNVGDADYGQYRLLAEIVKDNRKVGEILTAEFLSSYVQNLFKHGHNTNLHALKFFENIIFENAQPSFWNIDKLVRCLFDTNSFQCFFSLISPKSIGPKEPSSSHQFEFAIPEGIEANCIEDLPYIYHKNILSISNNILKYSLDPTNLRYFLSKIINLSYAYKLLSQPDVFDTTSDESILFSNFKPVLMEFIRQVWLINEKNSAKLSRNAFLVNFLKAETAKLVTLKPSKLAALRAAMHAESVLKKYQELQTVPTDSAPPAEAVDRSSSPLGRINDDSDDGDLISSHVISSQREYRQNNQRNKQYAFHFMKDTVMDVQSDYVMYLFKYLLPFVLDTFKCFIGFDSQQANVTTRSDYKAFADFAKEFSQFCQIEITREIFLSSIQIMAPLVKEFEEIFKEKISFAFDYQEEVQQFEKRKESPSISSSSTAPSATTVFDSRVQSIMSSNDATQNKLARISLAILNSDHVRVDIVRQERSQLVRALREGNRSNSLSTQNILKKLVNFIKNAVDELENDEGIIKSDDDVLANTIELLCDLLDSCTREEERQYMQNFLNLNGIIAVMVKCFCFKGDTGYMFEKLINLGVRLIQSSSCSNTAIQESFYTNLISAPNQEVFFLKIEQRIKEEIHFQAFQNKNVQQKIDAEVKTLPFSYSVHDKFSIKTLLSFLQLLFANSFHKLQRYLHFQHKSKTNHNILGLLVDLLEAYIGGRNFGGDRDGAQFLTDAIRCEKMVMTLETLILCIQGPTVENQVELAESKFLDIATYILRLNDSFEQFIKTASEEQDNRSNMKSISQQQSKHHKNSPAFIFHANLSAKQDFIVSSAKSVSSVYATRLQSLFEQGHPKNYRVWMLSQIKNKCISCLESLMDGENKIITKRIMSTIPPNVLKINLAWIFEKYETLFEKADYYDYELFEMKPVMQIFTELELCDHSTMLQQSLRQSLIIDSGFKMFKLLRFMLVQMSNNEVEIVYNEIAKSQAQILHKQSKKNIFYQLLGLFQDFGKIFTSLYTFLKKTESLNKRLRKHKALGATTSGSSAQNLEKMKIKAIKFFSKYSGQIEIVSNDKLVRVSFPKHPHCFSLTNSLKYKVTEKIDLYSPHSKVESISEQAISFIERLKFEHMFKAKLENNLTIAILANNLDLWKNLSYIVSILQNVLIVFYQTRTNVQSIFYFHFIGNNNVFQLTMQIFQISLASLVFFFFLLKKVPLINKKVSDIIASIEQEKFSINEHSMYQNQSKINYMTKLRNFKIKAWLFINDGELGYFLIYFSFALAGMFNEFFLALLLFDIFWRFPVLQNIIHAVWRPRRQILLTMFLFMICQYFFSLTAFYFFSDRFEHLCDNMLSCFSIMFDYMYKNDGGITSMFSPSGSDDFVHYYGLNYQLDWGSLWDFMYFFVIITLLFSIVSGIIIDTFGLLRDEEDEKKKNKRDYCLMCSIDRGTIDKLSVNRQGFQHHIDVEHNIWNYIFFISYLQEKNRNYFLGIEHEIYDKLQNKEISWFPLNRSMSVSQNAEQNEELENIQKKISSLESKFTNALDALLKSSKTTTQRIAKIDASQAQQLTLLQQQKNSYAMDQSIAKPRKFKRAGSSYFPSSIVRKQSDSIIEEEDSKPFGSATKPTNSLTSLGFQQCDSD